jgi:hypothetical protein
VRGNVAETGGVECNGWTRWWIVGMRCEEDFRVQGDRFLYTVKELPNMRMQRYVFLYLPWLMPMTTLGLDLFGILNRVSLYIQQTCM